MKKSSKSGPSPTDPEPPGSSPSGDADIDLGDWGFDLDDPSDRWLARLAAAEEPEELGRIGEYELVEEVSRGGQGVVFRARQPGTGRNIALKRLLAGNFATKAMRRRFQREIETAAALSHPNIVTVYGVEVVDGQPLLAMEWIDGVPINAWAAGHTASGAHDQAAPAAPFTGRDPTEVIEMFLRVCDAIRHAHARGVLHRDLKPSNILVDAQGQPHVLDFGLAKRFGAGAGAADGSVTLSSDFVGTPAYSSPEQLSPYHSSLDVRTDVYSLGVVLYEMLTGVTPFGERRSVGELLRAVESEEPDRPSSHDPRLSGEVDVIVQTAMAKDTADRYRTVDALAGDLRRHLAGEPILAIPPSAWVRLVKTVRRNRLAFSFAAVVFVLLSAFAIAATRHALALERERRIALDAQLEAEEAQLTAERERSGALRARDAERESRAAAQREADNANALLSFLLTDMLLAADARGGAGRNTVTMKDALDQAAPKIAERFHSQPETETSVRILVAQLYQGLGEYVEAREHYEAAERLIATQAEPDKEELVDVWLGLAYVIGTQGPVESVLDYHRRALALLDEELEGAHPQKVKVMNHLASNLLYMERLDEARPLLDRTIEMAQQLGDLGQIGHAAALLNLGEVDVRAERYDLAEQRFREAARIYGETQGEDLWQYAQHVQKVAWVCKLRGKLDEAEREYRRALEIFESVMGSNNVETANAKRALADVLADLDRHDEARELYESALDVLDRESKGSVSYAMAVYEYGNLLFDLGDVRGAEARIRESYEIHRALSGEEHRSTVYAKNRLAETWLALGDVEGAEAMQREVLDYVIRSDGPEHSNVALILADLALCVMRAGRLEEAHGLLLDGLARQGMGLRTDVVWAQSAFLELGVLCLTSGDEERAIDVFGAILEHLRREREPGEIFRLQAELGLVEALLATGRADEAEAHALRLGAETLEHFGPHHESTRELPALVARVFARRGAVAPDGIAEAAE